MPIFSTSRVKENAERRNVRAICFMPCIPDLFMKRVEEMKWTLMCSNDAQDSLTPMEKNLKKYLGYEKAKKGRRTIKAREFGKNPRIAN